MRLDPFVYVALHSTCPSIGMPQTCMEIQFDGYARQRIKKRNKQHSIQFAHCNEDVDFATHFSIGVLSEGDGTIIEVGEIQPPIFLGPGISGLLKFNLDISEILRNIKRNAKLAKAIS